MRGDGTPVGGACVGSGVRRLGEVEVEVERVELNGVIRMEGADACVGQLSVVLRCMRC